MARMIHSSFNQGSKIRLIFKDGTQVVTKYLGHRKGKSIQTEAGTFKILDIRAADYYKPLPWER
jgi:hypothetical protein